MPTRVKLSALRWLTKEEQRLGVIEAGPWLVVDVVDDPQHASEAEKARAELVQHVYREVRP